MRQDPVVRPGIKRGLLTAALALGFGLAAGPALAAEGLNKDADEILRSMSAFLAGTKSFSVSAGVSNEIITLDGQKLQLNSRAAMVLDRPSRFFVTRSGRFVDAELIFDGKILTMYGKDLNAYVQRDFAGTADQALSAIESGSGLNLPATDLFLADPYSALSSGVTGSGYYGRSYVGGVRCHHLGFRKDKVDWQIWVKDGDEPLPMKYVITSKWIAGAPQYSVELSDWNLKPAIAADRFDFTVPPGAKKLEALAVDETGEFAASEESK